MKVLYVSECYPSEEQPQYCIFLEQQAIELQKLGNNVSVLVPRKAEPNGLSAVERNGITVYSMGYSMTFLQRSCVLRYKLPELSNFLQKQQFDIVAIQIATLALQWEVVRASHLVGSKVVIHYHGLNIWGDYYPTHAVYQRLIFPLKKSLTRRIDAVVCVSHSVEKEFREHNSETPSYVVYNGVDISRFVPNPNKCNSSFTVLCVANLIRIKGQEYLIEAIAELKKQGRDVRLQLIGDGADKQRLVNLVASLNLQDEVAFLGIMPYDTVAQYMANADMFILPSYYEALGCVYLESMASGTLTCGCNIYGPAELISHMKTGLLIEPKRVSSIVDAVSFAMDNPELDREIVKNGIDWSSENTWNKSAETLNSAYISVISEYNTKRVSIKQEMKAAIITQAYETKNGTNYGNRLQNYGLQELLISLELSPETVAQKNIKITKPIISLLKNAKNYLRIITEPNYRLRQNSFNKFNKQYIVWGKEKFNYNIVPRGIENEYDYFIVGSDQVWNTEPKDMRERRNIYLATFAAPSKRIAYAASFGISYISEDCIADFKRELPKFKAISVREQEGIRLVEECGSKATVVLDPTLMLTDKQWNTLAQKPRFDLKGDYILTYFLGTRDERMCQYIERIAGGREIVNLNDINNSHYYSVSPDEFVWLFAHADCVLTDSFHGTVFSILYHRPFMVFDRLVNGKKSGMESRIDTLLSTFHLEQCRGNIDNPCGEPGGGNWDEVEKILAAKREKSLDFLKKALDLA